MAASIIKYLKTLIFTLIVCSHTLPLGAQVAESYRAKIIEAARQDVGMFEGRSNTGPVQKYVKFWNQYNSPIDLQSAYCGLAMDYWHKKAGVKPNISFTPRAINWFKFCANPVAIWNLTPAQLSDLKPAGALVFQSSHGNHVGLFEKYADYTLYSYEGNTSTARSVTKYPRTGEGVFRLRTPINNKTLKPLYYCDTIKQASEWKIKA
jgi:hypothetical protein